MRVETDIGVKKTYGRHAKHQGRWAGIIKILHENKANIDIEAENMKREEEARKREEEAREEMRAVVQGAMQRRAEEGTAELERTRQAVKVIIDSA
jgi:isopropylmalate/homocitrate/citramalate synthase